jgi:hypothetical protein
MPALLTPPNKATNATKPGMQDSVTAVVGSGIVSMFAGKTAIILGRFVDHSTLAVPNRSKSTLPTDDI